MSKIQYPDKINLAQKPTPIQFMPFLSSLASKHKDIKVFVKRDDLNHGPAAGNKIRKLEFLLAEAKKRNAKVILTTGSVQSNHARATAILARELGMETVLVLKGDPHSAVTGNLLLDQIVGSRILFVNDEEYKNVPSLFQSLIESYRSEGITAYAIPEGGSNDLGVAGYVAAMEEIASQCGVGEVPKRFQSIFCATGSGGTYAGLLLGRNLLDWDDGITECYTFNVCRTSEEFKLRITNLMVAAVQRFKWPVSFMAEDIKVIDGYVGPGYAKTNDENMKFILDVAKHDGLLLDPVYTGKAVFGFIKEIHKSPDHAEAFGENVLFVHTGGLPSLMAYEHEFKKVLAHG